MEARRVRLFEQRLRTLHITIPQPFDAMNFARNVAESRARPLHVLTADTSEAAAPCGLWLSTSKADYVVVDEQAPPVLRNHYLLHELAHMICGHQGMLHVDLQALGLDLIDPKVIERVLGRDGGATDRYATQEEREAEGLASVIAKFAAECSPVPRSATKSDDAASALERISSALAGDRYWS